MLDRKPSTIFFAIRLLMVIMQNRSSANYGILAPISMSFSLISIGISLSILLLICCLKQFHSVTYLLMCNTCLSSIFFCLVQWINYIYLLFIASNTSDHSCRWRAYFGYMSVVAVIYSYLFQAISRYIFTILSRKFPWMTTWQCHWALLAIYGTMVVLLPLPSIITNDIRFRAGFLCWVPKKAVLHMLYTILLYYLIPIFSILCLYFSISIRLRSHRASTEVRRRNDRDLRVYRNLMILLSVYILGGVPTLFYVLTGIEVFYSIGTVTVSLTVTIEKVLSVLIDRQLRNLLKRYFLRLNPRIAPAPLQILPGQH